MNRPKASHLTLGLAALTVLLITVDTLPAQRRGGRQRPDRAPQAGAMAPDFTLSVLNSEEMVTLSELAKEKPVALLFGSWT